jgi:hypothetical protein
MSKGTGTGDTRDRNRRQKGTRIGSKKDRNATQKRHESKEHEQNEPGIQTKEQGSKRKKNQEQKAPRR